MSSGAPTWRAAACAAFLGLGAAAHALRAQTPAPAPTPRSTRDGVYTTGQAREGAAIFEQHCSRCHSAQEYRSERFRTRWTARPLYDLYAMVSTTMPFDQPASLHPERYAEVLAFILEVNGFPAGDAALGWERKELAGITIDPPP